MNWEYLGKEALPPGKFAPQIVETWRAKVPGGWLVLTSVQTTPTHSVTFYLDPAHEWDGGTLQ